MSSARLPRLQWTGSLIVPLLRCHRLEHPFSPAPTPTLTADGGQRQTLTWTGLLLSFSVATPPPSDMCLVGSVCFGFCVLVSRRADSPGWRRLPCLAFGPGEQPLARQQKCDIVWRLCIIMHSCSAIEWNCLEPAAALWSTWPGTGGSLVTTDTDLQQGTLLPTFQGFQGIGAVVPPALTLFFAINLN